MKNILNNRYSMPNSTKGISDTIYLAFVAIVSIGGAYYIYNDINSSTTNVATVKTTNLHNGTSSSDKIKAKVVVKKSQPNSHHLVEHKLEKKPDVTSKKSIADTSKQVSEKNAAKNTKVEKVAIIEKTHKQEPVKANPVEKLVITDAVAKTVAKTAATTTVKTDEKSATVIAKETKKASSVTKVISETPQVTNATPENNHATSSNYHSQHRMPDHNDMRSYDEMSNYMNNNMPPQFQPQQYNNQAINNNRNNSNNSNNNMPNPNTYQQQMYQQMQNQRRYYQQNTNQGNNQQRYNQSGENQYAPWNPGRFY